MLLYLFFIVNAVVFFILNYFDTVETSCVEVEGASYFSLNCSQTCPCVHLNEAVTCIKRAAFSCPVIGNFVLIDQLLRGHLSYKATFSLSQRWFLKQIWVTRAKFSNNYCILTLSYPGNQYIQVLNDNVQLYFQCLKIVFKE